MANIVEILTRFLGINMKFNTTINKVFWIFNLIFFNLAAYAVSTSEKQDIARRLLIPSTGENTGSSHTTVRTSAHSHIQTDTPGSGEVGKISDFGTGLAQLIKKLAIFGGVVLILFSVQLYVRRRKNPMETSLFIVVIVFLFGLALIGLSFAPLKF